MATVAVQTVSAAGLAAAMQTLEDATKTIVAVVANGSNRFTIISKG